MYVVDASVWVSSVLPDEIHHHASVAWLQRHATGGAIVTCPTLVLPEVAGALSRRLGDPEVARETVEQMRGLSGLRLVWLDFDGANRAARLATNLRLRGSDAVYVAVADLYGLPLVTWDNELRERARQVIETRVPVLT